VNEPHYAELVAALAALDFFSIDLIPPQTRQLHFADTVRQGKDVGVNWESLPVHPDFAVRREEIKRKLVAFTTFTFLNPVAVAIPARSTPRPAAVGYHPHAA